MNAKSNEVPSAPPHRFPHRWFWLVPCLFFLALSLPTIRCYLAGDRLSEVVGEITAYRYFYSLRMLYGEGESPWVPNGHTVGLAFKLINHGLTALGISPANIYPRIDLALSAFNFAAFFAAAVLLWLLRKRAPNDLWVCGLAGLGLGILYQEKLLSGHFTIVPDYPNLILPIALATLLLTPSSEPLSRPWLRAAVLVVFGTLLLATKLTFISFYLFAAASLLFALPRWSQRIACGLVLAVVPLLLSLALLFLYHNFQWEAVSTNLHFIQDFLRNSEVAKPIPYPTWLRNTLLQHWQTGSYFGFCAVLTPFIAIVGLLFSKTRTLAALTLLCSIIPHALIFRRPHAYSFIEVNFLLFVVLFVFLFDLAKLHQPAATRRAFFLSGAFALMVMVWWMIQLPSGLRQIQARIEECNTSGQEVTAFVNRYPGKTLFLIPNNSYNLPSLDCAISKGGTDMHSNTWGDSPFMVQLFQEKTYLFGYSPLAAPYDLTPFKKLIVTILHNDERGTHERLMACFKVDLSDYVRRFHYRINPSVEIVGYIRDKPDETNVHSLLSIDTSQPLQEPLYLSPRELKATCTVASDSPRHWTITAQEKGPYLALCYSGPFRLPQGSTLRIRTSAQVDAGRKLLIQVSCRDEDGTGTRTLGREFVNRSGLWEDFSHNLYFPRETTVESLSIGVIDVKPGDGLRVRSFEAEVLGGHNAPLEK